VREENPRAAWIPAVPPRVRESLLLTTDQLVVIASAPSEPPLIRGDNQRRMEESVVRTDDRAEVGMIACYASRP
jgi:hypothetical protein